MQAELADGHASELEPILGAMQRPRSDLEDHLGGLRDASKESWESIREHLALRFGPLRHALREANERLAD